MLINLQADLWPNINTTFKLNYLFPQLDGGSGLHKIVFFSNSHDFKFTYWQMLHFLPESKKTKAAPTTASKSVHFCFQEGHKDWWVRLLVVTVTNEV